MVSKPCHQLGFCPFGPLVEEFPLKAVPDEQSCTIFGHDCPVFHCAEPFVDGAGPATVQLQAWKDSV